jgi:hypothetical protein
MSDEGLVAKHNLPPYQNADDTYPIPNSAIICLSSISFFQPPYCGQGIRVCKPLQNMTLGCNAGII